MLQNESRYNVGAKTDKTTFKEVGKRQGRDGNHTNPATWQFLASWLCRHISAYGTDSTAYLLYLPDLKDETDDADDETTMANHDSF